MPFDPKHTAVVLIEYQNDFTSEGGALHGAVGDVMESTGMLENTRALVDAARAAGATIVHAPITFAPGYGELADHPYGILKGVVDSTAFVKGEWGAEIVDSLAPQEGDVVVEGKRGLDTFATTNLDFILRARGITTIALGGFLTNCCVESTMRTGYEKGYQVDHAVGLRRRDLRRGAPERHPVRLPDVLRGDDRRGVHRRAAGRYERALALGYCQLNDPEVEMGSVIGASTGWWIGLVLGIVVIAVAAVIVITVVMLARRIAGQARGAVDGVKVVQAQTDELAGIGRINDSGVRILHSARALRKVAVGK